MQLYFKYTIVHLGDKIIIFKRFDILVYGQVGM